ncbi:MAG: DUF2202 domain-containing protein [Bacteroidetes bacterium]|nr:DUF2202 domain-containing protein [Bacteroidota bacterium]
MKNLFVLMLLGLFSQSCDQSNIEPVVFSTDLSTAINLPSESLSDFEKNSLILMREEEKLARDIYTYLYKKWGINVFNNISKSEDTHTSAILSLLNKYQITDPVGKNAAGVFDNAALQKLYNDLTTQGSATITAGLNVGATVEDLDIFDLMEAQKQIDNQDINAVYANLTKGSRNHIRSFTARLSDYGVTYKAQYIEETLLKDILNSPMETGGH